MERSVARHRQCLHAAAKPPPPSGAGGALEDSPPPAVSAGSRRGDRIADRTRQRHAAICQLLAEGRSIRVIAADLGLARNTVRRFARAASPGEFLVHDGTGRRSSILDDYEPYLRERWNAGCTDATALWRELRARGYPGGYSLVRDYLARFRGTPAMPPPPPAPPKPRTVTSWIMTRPGTLAPGDQSCLEVILGGCPELAAVTTHVRAFAALMTERRGHDLEQWMTTVTASGDPALRSFVTGLRRDQDAVTAGLTLRWSSGSVEGHVNRIKMLKRQMYGRASPDLLRRRVLLAD